MKMQIKIKIKKGNRIEFIVYNSDITVKSTVWSTYIVPARCQS